MYHICRYAYAYVYVYTFLCTCKKHTHNGYIFYPQKCRCFTLFPSLPDAIAAEGPPPAALALFPPRVLTGSPLAFWPKPAPALSTPFSGTVSSLTRRGTAHALPYLQRPLASPPRESPPFSRLWSPDGPDLPRRTEPLEHGWVVWDARMRGCAHTCILCVRVCMRARVCVCALCIMGGIVTCAYFLTLRQNVSC